MTWWGFLLAGFLWIAVVCLVALLILSGIPEAVDAGIVKNPESGRVFMAIGSSVLFAIPGIGFIVIGLRRRRVIFRI